VLYKIVNEAPEPIDTDQLRGISPAIRSVLDRTLTKNPDDRFQTAEELAKALRAAKDPSWMGQLEDATAALLRASAPTASASSLPSSSAPTAQAPSIPSSSAPTFQSPAFVAPVPPPIPAPRPAPAKSGNKGLWLGLAALALIGVGGTTWWFLKGPAAPGPVAAEVKQDPLPTDPGKKSQGTARPASGNSAQLQTAGPSLGSKSIPSGPSNADPKSDYRPQPPRPEPAKPPSRPADTKAPTKAIDQPELYHPEKLETLEVHERKNLGNVSFSEAIQVSESQPDKAILGFRQALKADPSNAGARAWLAWVLSTQGRTAEFVKEVREGQRLGLLGQMQQNPRFRGAFMKARLNQQLPPDLAN
jgi:serine/threonine-protein kinase